MTTRTELDAQRQEILQLRANTTCPRHPRYDDANCTTCRGERKGAGAEDADWWTEKASRACDRRFPLEHAVAELGENEAVIAWAERCRKAPRTAPSMLISGPTGVGKTWQAYAALRYAVTQPRRVDWLAMTVVDFFSRLRSTPTLTERQRLFESYCDIGVLLLDDLGAEKPSAWTEEVLGNLIDHRSKEHRPMIITTNIEPAALVDRYGDRIDSRLDQMCLLVEMTGDDRRERRW